MKRKLFTLDDDLVERIGLEGNQSRVVNDALRLYYVNKETVKRLVGLADRLENKLSPEVTLGQTNKHTPLPERESDDEPPHGFIDPTNRQRKWDGYMKEWVPN